jgi:hypothetical protein
MIAASLLVAAVVAAYASLAMLSLSASTSGIVLGAAANVEHLVGSVGWQPPSVTDLGGYVAPSTAPTAGSGAVQISAISWAPTRGSVTHAVRVGNSSAKPLLLKVEVVGNQTLGMTASFATAAGGSTMLVPAHTAELVSLVADPFQAGVLDAELEVSVPGSGVAPHSVQITGAQAPLPPGAVTATPAAGGAVDLSWSPSPSTGVTGYIVQSSTGGSPFTPVGNSTTSTSVVEQTGTNATTFSYQVVAITAGVALPSAPGPAGSVTTDSLAPVQPNSVSMPNINVANVDSVPVTVILPPSSNPSDTIVVTITDSAGNTFAGHPISGNPGPAVVQIPAGTLVDGSVYASATTADSLGNTSLPVRSGSMLKITAPANLPDAPGSVLPSDLLITTANAAGFSVLVKTSAADAAAGDTISVTLAGQQSLTTPPVSAQADGSVSIPVDVSGLDDGKYAVSATVTDPVGNTATTSGGPVTIDTSGPDKPTSFGIAAGPDNPAGVINAQSQTAVTIAGHFPSPLEDGETMTISIDHGTPLPVEVVPGSQDFTLGPLDLSGLPDGEVALKMKLTDVDGNVTLAWRDNGTKETSGPTGPSSVGVPAGPDNPAGYVNTATQSAATIVAGFDAPTDPADQIALTVGGDSNFPVQAGGSSQVIWNNLDLSQLGDGNVPIVVTVTDANGNTTRVSGTLIKDTQAPPAPVAAHVLGPPLDTILPGEASCVKVGVAFNQAPDSSDTVTVTLSDGQASVQGSTQAGNGQVTVGCIDASSLAAGTVAVSVTVTDVAGNSTTMTGTDATDSCHHGSE